MGKKALRKYRAALARTGGVRMSGPDRVKYSEDQPRDEQGRWTSAGSDREDQRALGRPTGPTVRYADQMHEHLAGRGPMPRVGERLPAVRTARGIRGGWDDDMERLRQEQVRSVGADPATARCESGWTGDRCGYGLFHPGDHSNE